MSSLSSVAVWRADRRVKLRLPVPGALRVTHGPLLELRADLDALCRTVTINVRSGPFTAPGPAWQPVDPHLADSGALPWAPLRAGAARPDWTEVRMRPTWHPENDEEIYAARPWLGSWRRGSAHKARWTAILKAAPRQQAAPLTAMSHDAQRARHVHGGHLLALQALTRAAAAAVALRVDLEPAALRWLLIQAALDPTGRRVILRGEL